MLNTAATLLLGPKVPDRHDAVSGGRRHLGDVGRPHAEVLQQLGTGGRVDEPTRYADTPEYR